MGKTGIRQVPSKVLRQAGYAEGWRRSTQRARRHEKGKLRCSWKHYEQRKKEQV